MANTTTGNVTSAMDQHVLNTAVHTYKKTRFFCQFAKTKQLPAGKSTYKFPVTDKMTGSATTLTEGVTPTNKGMTRQGVDVTLEQFGDYVTLTDLVLQDNPFPLVEESVMELTELVGNTVDSAAQDVIDSGTNVKYVGQSARNAITGTNILTIQEIANGVTALRDAGAPTFDGESYIAIMHPNTYHDLLINTAAGGFLDVTKYSHATKIFDGEVGKMYGARIIMSNNVQKYAGAGAGSVNVYPTFMFGKDAYAEVQSGNLATKYKALGSGGSDDPLDQRATVACKVRTGFAILKENGLFRIESASSRG